MECATKHFTVTVSLLTAIPACALSQAIDDAGQHGHRGSGSGSNTHALGRARAISGDAGLPERGNALRALAGPGVTALQRDVVSAASHKHVHPNLHGTPCCP